MLRRVETEFTDVPKKEMAKKLERMLQELGLYGEPAAGMPMRARATQATGARKAGARATTAGGARKRRKR